MREAHAQPRCYNLLMVEGQSKKRENIDLNPATMEMNNFFMLMPGGEYRRLLSKRLPRENDEEYNRYTERRKKQVEAIDKLLREEFPNLEADKICPRMLQNGRRWGKLWNESMEKDVLPERLREINEEMNKIRQQDLLEKEKLRPLFIRLVEIGFAPIDLIR